MSQASLTRLCRRYYSFKKTGRGIPCVPPQRCRFDHPDPLSAEHDREFERALDHCYCGSALMTVVNTRPRSGPEDDGALFYKVCSRTRKSIRNCCRT